MNSFVVVFAIVALALAEEESHEGISLVQDTLGNYKLGYKTVNSSRSEQGYGGGKVVGSYTYNDDNGAVHTIKYVADPSAGFIAEGDLPVQVQETPEVAAARAAHLAIIEQTRALLPELKEEDEEIEEPKIPVHRFDSHKKIAKVQAATKIVPVGEKSIKLVAPSSLRLSSADLKALTAAIQSAKSKNIPLESIKIAPSSLRQVVRPAAAQKVKPDNLTDLSAAIRLATLAHSSKSGKIVPSSVRRVAAEKVKEEKKAEKKVDVDHSAEIELERAELFSAHRLAIENLAKEYRKIANRNTE